MQGLVSLYSNSPNAPTGYGVQSKMFLDLAVRDGLTCAVQSNYGVEGTNTTWQTAFGAIPHYARGSDVYSNDTIAIHHAHHKQSAPNLPDLLVTLYDQWVFTADLKMPIAAWTPVDHDPIPPKVAAFLKRENVTPVAMSRFGQRAMESAGISAEYVPHAYDPTVFKPTKKIKGVPNRDYLGIDNSKFVVMMNAANKGVYPNRKAFGENLLAFAIFALDKPDVVLYLHTEPFGMAGGINLPDLLESVNIPKDKVLFADPVEYRYGISQETLAGLYSAADVLLATSYGEGFGVPTIEAQACGTPVIASNFAASAELVSPDGFLVNGQPLWDAPQKTWFNTPNVPEIVEALQKAYDRGRGDFPATREFVKEYEVENVWQTYWKPLLSQLLLP